MTISPSRVAAFDILLSIESEHAFSSVLLPAAETNLSPSDRALCHTMTLGVLRRQMFLDRVLDRFTAGKKMDPEVRVALRLGLFQLWFLDRVPAHSAVNESVELVRRAKKSSARGFVNAILRRIPKEPVSLTFEDESERISVETSHPRWLIERWSAEFGTDAAAQIALANNMQPPVAFRRTARSALDVSFAAARPSHFVPGCYIADRLTSELSEAAARRDIYLQDEGSQLVANAVEVPDGGLFLDVCAAPGSKLTQIGADQRARFCTAGDVHFHRARFLLDNIRAQGVENAAVVQYDAENELPFAEACCDTVLVDAPCSGTGTIRHNPELRYFLQSADIAQLSAKQLRILRNASKSVKSGGTLVYSTCSLEVEENERVADAFLAAEPGFRKATPPVPEQFVTGEGYARTRPDRHGMDGFFIAKFARSGSDRI